MEDIVMKDDSDDVSQKNNILNIYRQWMKKIKKK